MSRQDVLSIKQKKLISLHFVSVILWAAMPRVQPNNRSMEYRSKEEVAQGQSALHKSCQTGQPQPIEPSMSLCHRHKLQNCCWDATVTGRFRIHWGRVVFPDPHDIHLHLPSHTSYSRWRCCSLASKWGNSCQKGLSHLLTTAGGGCFCFRLLKKHRWRSLGSMKLPRESTILAETASPQVVEHGQLALYGVGCT